MQVRDTDHLVEAFLVLDQPRQRLGHWCAALAALDGPDAPPLAGVSAYYDPSTDQVLLGLRYAVTALGPGRLGFLVELALLAEIGMIQPAELTEADRRRFLRERLTRCTIHVGERTEVIDALIEIVRRVREHKAIAAKATMTLRALPLRPPGEPGDLAETGSDAEPVLLVRAKGTRDGVPPPALAHDPRRLRDVHEGDTRPISAVEAYRQATATMARDEAPGRPPLPAGGGARPTPTVTPPPSQVIYARYLRSGRWVPTRIGALSLKGAALMTGALPRMNDHVDVALAFGPHRALVRGNVGKVSSVHEARASGTATFSVSFELDPGARRQLTALLTAARAANIMIKPPPPRAARRYPVEWPLCLGTPRGAVRAEALDISADGMFVRTPHALPLDSLVQYSSVLDDDEAPIAGRARVVRAITEDEARAAGLTPGFGLQLLDAKEDDRLRWLAFLGRIERRAEHRVLIGAPPARLAEIQGALSAVGYAVTGAADPGALAQLAGAEIRPPDAAVVDASWLTGAREGWLDAVLGARGVPTATLAGDARRARDLVDRLLHIAPPPTRGAP